MKFKKNKYWMMLAIASLFIFQNLIYSADAADTAKADEPEKIAPNYLTGDWGGLRQKMADKGVTFETVYTSESNFNAKGGLSQGYSVLGNLDITLDMDMEKMLGWSGGEIFIYGLGGHGMAPTEMVGDIQVTSNIEAGMNYFKLYQIWLKQGFLNNRLVFLAGLHDFNSECYTTRTSGLFFNSSFGIGADLSQTGSNGPSIFPSTAPAVRMKIEPVEHFYLNFGGYNAIAGNPDKPEATAADFTFEKGFLLTGEIGYEDEGDIKLAAGVWDYTKPEKDFSDADAPGFGIYVLFDKTLGEVFSFFIRGGMANPQVYQIAYNISEGIHLSGKIWGRDDDELGLGVTTVINSAKYLDQLNSQGVTMDVHETAFELTYKIQATPWVSIQPDFQYVLNPGTNPDVADAYVIAMRARMSF